MRSLKILFLILLLVVTAKSNSQSLAILDQKNGFKELKFGDPISKWEKMFIEQMDAKQAGVGEKSYSINSPCCDKVFEFKIEQLVVTFYEDKLVRIYITIENFKNHYQLEYTNYGQGYKQLNSNFSSLFGSPTGSQMPPNGNPCHEWTYWIGEKVYLKTYYKYLGIYDGDIAIVDIGSKKYLETKNKSGF